MNKPLFTGQIYLRFFYNIEKTVSGCWNWLASKDVDGYGNFYSEDLNERRAHRASYKLFIGDIPKGLFILHSCNNPSCCNPNHLRIGTAQDNATDCVKAGNSGAGFKNGRCKLTPLELNYIKSQRGILGSRRLSKLVNIGRSQIENIWNGSHKYD